MAPTGQSPQVVALIQNVFGAQGSHGNIPLSLIVGAGHIAATQKDQLKKNYVTFSLNECLSPNSHLFVYTQSLLHQKANYNHNIILNTDKSNSR